MSSLKINNRARWAVFWLVVNLLLSFVLQALPGVQSAKAQSPVRWSPPINLSHSGSASDPSFTIDSEGTIHVLWRDELAGYYYVSGDGLQWQAPLQVQVPFTDESPVMLADGYGFIHLFWRSSDEGLYYSYVKASEFTSLSSWSPTFQLSVGSLDFAVTIDTSGTIHLAYVRPIETPDFPAGVYYRRKAGNTGAWSEPILLYQSSYFRSLGYEDSQVAIASSAIAESSSVFVTWDNRPRQRIYFARSVDGGQTWDSPLEVKGPDLGSGVISPFNLQVNVSGREIMLLWQGRDGGGTCSQFLQFSLDEGDAWEITAQRFDRLSACSQESKFLHLQDGTTLLWTLNQGQVYLLAWDGERWSNPQAQYELNGFDDPETLRPVALGCMQAELKGGDVLVVLGCDLGGGGDIWFLSRRLTDISSWFPSQSDWMKPADVSGGETPTGRPVLVAGPGEIFHLLWSQADEAARGMSRKRIYYSAWKGTGWTNPTAILESPAGDADHPSAAVDANGRLLVVWSDSKTGEILFSWATAEKANLVSEWSPPEPLPVPPPITLSPVILADSSGLINVIYSVPINEKRGVYLIQSRDGGETWTAPVTVFDATSAAWQVVGDTHFMISPQGGYYLLVMRRSFAKDGPTETDYQGVYYTYSIDRGRNWAELEAVDTGAVTWGQISQDASGHLYRIWQIEIQGQPQIRYQFSSDGGVSWEPAETLSSFGESLRFTQVVPDQAGNLHLLQIVRDSTNRLILHHWFRERTKWSISESLELGYGQDIDVNSMAVTLSPGGKLGFVYSTSLKSTATTRYGLLFTYRVLGNVENPPSVPVPQPNPVVVSPLAPTPTLRQSVVATLTPTPDLSRLGSLGSPPEGGNTFAGVEVGVALSLLIIGVVFGIGILRIRANQ